MGKKLLIVVAVVAAIFGIGFLLPGEQLVGRSVAINASPETIYEQVRSLQTWAWAPWSRLRYDGPEAGVGARMVWQDEAMGEGRLWLTKADPLRGVSYEMSLSREPFTATGAVQFLPGDASTLVVWTWKGRYSDPIARLMGMVAGERLGARFEQGLLALKRIAEASAPFRPPPSSAAPPEAETAGAPAPAEAPPEPADAPAAAEPQREAVVETAPPSADPVATPAPQ